MEQSAHDSCRGQIPRAHHCSSRPARDVLMYTLAVAIGTPVALFWLFTGAAMVGALALYEEETACNVARIGLHGELYSSGIGGDLVGYVDADTILSELHDAEASKELQAVLLDVDSPGGAPVAADTLARAFASSSIPTVAVIRDIGTSAAYWAALGTGHVIASPVSDVGSIGVTMSYAENAGVLEEEGGRFVELASGRYKDAGNPDRTLSEEEQDYFKGQVDEVHVYFVDAVARMRPALTRATLEALSDGRSFTGLSARRAGLIDELGGLEEGMQYLARTLEVPRDKLVLCDYGQHELEWLE